MTELGLFMVLLGKGPQLLIFQGSVNIGMAHLNIKKVCFVLCIGSLDLN